MGRSETLVLAASALPPLTGRQRRGTTTEDLSHMAATLNRLGNRTAEQGVKFGVDAHLSVQFEKQREVETIMERTDPDYVNREKKLQVEASRLLGPAYPAQEKNGESSRTYAKFNQRRAREVDKRGRDILKRCPHRAKASVLPYLSKALDAVSGHQGRFLSQRVCELCLRL